MNLKPLFLQAIRAVVLAGLMLVVVVQPGGAEEKDGGVVSVVERQRLGSYIEETAFISNGPHANHIAMVTGTEVYAVPVNPQANAAMQLLFDVRMSGVGVGPKGMTYIGSQKLFAFADAENPETLFVTDHNGNPELRPITYLPGPLNFLHNEGMTYLPENSTFYPDHLVMIANRFPPVPPFIEASLEILRLDGTVVKQIFLEEPLRSNYLTGIALKTPGQFLVGLNNEIWTVDFEGHIVSGPVQIPGGFVEGLEQLPDGRIVASHEARLSFFDAQLNRRPQDDRDAGIGVGLIGLSGLAWNPDTGRYLAAVNFEDSGNYFVPAIVAALPPSLDDFDELFTIAPNQRFRSYTSIDYLPDEHRVAIMRQPGGGQPGQIALHDETGALAETVNISLASPLTRPYRFTYIPTTQQFAVVFFRSSRNHQLAILSRTGQLVRQIDLASKGIQRPFSVTFFNPQHPSGGQFLIFEDAFFSTYRAVVTDFDFNVLQEFDFHEELGLLEAGDLSTVTSGPHAGSFAIDTYTNFEVVVFNLNEEDGKVKVKESSGIEKAKNTPLHECLPAKKVCLHPDP